MIERLPQILRNPRNQLILVLLMITLSGAYLWKTLRYTSRMEEIEVLTRRDNTLTRANQMAREAVGQGMETIRRAIEAYDRQAAAVSHLLPPDSLAKPLLPFLAEAAEAHEVAVTALTPLDDVSGPKYTTKQVRLEVQGRYHDIGAFLAAIGSFDQIARVRNFEAAVMPAKAREAGESSSRLISAKMVVETYVLGTQATDPTAEVARRPGSKKSGDAKDDKGKDAYSTYVREGDRIWQLVHIPGRPNPVRVPVPAANRKQAEAWLARNRGN